MTLDQYTIFCILWSFTATIIQTTVPRYKKANTWKHITLGLVINYIFAPICFILAMLRWYTDLLLEITDTNTEKVR